MKKLEIQKQNLLLAEMRKQKQFEKREKAGFEFVLNWFNNKFLSLVKSSVLNGNNFVEFKTMAHPAMTEIYINLLSGSFSILMLGTAAFLGYCKIGRIQ